MELRGGRLQWPRRGFVLIELVGSKGLGDALYLRAAVLHLLRRKEAVKVYTKWPDVYSDLPVSIGEHGRGFTTAGVRFFTSSVYLSDPPPGVDEFTFCCRNAGIEDTVEWRIDWKVRNHALLDRIKRAAGDRKIFIYQPLKVPRNGDQEALTPNPESFNKVIVAHRDYYRIKLGHPPFVMNDQDLPFELDMFGKGFIFDTLDICTIGDLFFGQPCFVPQVAAALGRPSICMFSRRASISDRWIRRVNPEWCVHKKELTKVMYDE